MSKRSRVIGGSSARLVSCLLLPALVLGTGLASSEAKGSPPAGQFKNRAPEARGLGPTLDQFVARRELGRSWKTQILVSWDPASGCPAALELQPPLPLRSRTIKAATREALRRLAPVYGWRGWPQLHFVGQQRADGFGVYCFEQRIGAAKVEGSELRVAFEASGAKGQRRLALRWLRGRVFRSLPLRLPSFPRPKPTRKARFAGIRLLGAKARRVATLRPDGVWKPAWSSIEQTGTLPERVLRDGRGRVLLRSPLFQGSGQVLGRVFPSDPRAPSAVVPIAGLDVFDSPRQRMTRTDARGGFTGAASLPAGLMGSFERVSAQAGAFPSVRSGLLDLRFSPQDPRIEELNVFYHLVQTRRWLARYRDVPGVEAALKKTIVASVRVSFSSGAGASTAPGELDGQRYDYVLIFGHLLRSCALDASVIVHERIHLLLNALGFEAAGGETPAIHEGLSDYFAASRLSSPIVTGYSGGAFHRDLRSLRVYPTHVAQDPHETGLILAGALWSARKTMGARLDRLVLQTIPQLSSSSTLREFARALLQLAERTSKAPTLRQSLVRHGLVDETESGKVNQAPVLEISRTEGGKDTPVSAGLFVIRPDVTSQSPPVLVLRATDPEGSPTTLGVDGLESMPFAEAESPKGGKSKSTRIRFKAPYFEGAYPLTVTAQDSAGKTSVEQLIVVVGSKGSLEPTKRVVVRAPVGVTTSVDLAKALAADPEAASEWAPLLAKPGATRLVGARVCQATLAGGSILVRPRRGEEGVHSFGLALRYPWFREQKIEVLVLVGQGPRIDVSRPFPTLLSEYGRPALIRSPQGLAPGQSVTVTAGEALQLSVKAWAEMPQEPMPDGGRTDSSGGAGVVLSLEPPRGTGLKARLEARSNADGTLHLSAPASSGARAFLVTLVAKAGERVRRRSIRVLVIPPRSETATSLTRAVPEATGSRSPGGSSSGSRPAKVRVGLAQRVGEVQAEVGPQK
jgi:hypothetical protein